MKFFLTFIILIVFSSFILVESDDELSKDAVDLIERANSDGASESFLYLYGIFASEDESPSDVGRERLKEYQKSDANEYYDVKEYPASEKISLPGGDEFCWAWEVGCLEYVFSSKVDVKTLLQENKQLIDRSNIFLGFDEYKTLSRPTIHEVFPPYQYVIAAERIKVLEAIYSYRSGNAQDAVDSLLLQFSGLRRMMSFQDSLIGKLIFLMKLSEIIDVLSVILTSEKEVVGFIPGLSQSEKDFSVIVSREFSVNYKYLEKLDSGSGSFEGIDCLKEFILRIMCKPNIKINSLASIYVELEGLAVLSPFDFSEKIEERNSGLEALSGSKASLNRMIFEIPYYQYVKYIARFQDFEAKLALFNQIHHFGVGLSDMKNPYYGSEVPREEDGSLCFDGPLEDGYSLRCLRVKI